MKSLNEYLTESKEVFTYRVKVAGELPSEVFDKFKAALDAYDVETVSNPKTTPVMKDPFGFPGLENTELNLFTVTLNYPASFAEIIDLARLSGIEPATIRVLSGDYDESMQAEIDATVGDDSTRLETPDYPAQTPEQAEASRKYSEGFKDIVQNAASTDFEIAGDKTPAAKFNTDSAQNANSPMTKVINKKPTAKEMGR
jgi:hypothetical protein